MHSRLHPHMPRLRPYASQVFVLGRMGLNREALELMLEQRGDMARAIEFVQRAGDGREERCIAHVKVRRCRLKIA